MMPLAKSTAIAKVITIAEIFAKTWDCGDGNDLDDNNGFDDDGGACADDTSNDDKEGNG